MTCLVEYLDLDDLLLIGRDAVGGEVVVRDYGLLESALARPQTTVFGADAYPDLPTKAAALLHSLARNHALVDGNKRLAWLATYVFLDINGLPGHRHRRRGRRVRARGRRRGTGRRRPDRGATARVGAGPG